VLTDLGLMLRSLLITVSAVPSANDRPDSRSHQQVHITDQQADQVNSQSEYA
jgi:hypothetical protein